MVAISRARRNAYGLGLALLICGLFGAGPAHAQYELCNRTSYAMSAALGYVDQGSLITRGWWRLRAGECKRVLSESVKPGRYFVYAEAIQGHRGALRSWSGRTPLCVQNESLFTLRNQNVCTDDPRSQRDFQAIDVGPGTDGSFTTEITEEANFTESVAQVAGVQRLLSDVGLFKGAIDGNFGSTTKQALIKYQQSKGLGGNGAISDVVIDALIDDANAAELREGLILCNSTMFPIWSALAQPRGREGSFTSAGWWRLESQKCTKVRRGTVAKMNFYVYGVMEAESKSLPLAGGDTPFCISKVQFESEGDEACAEAGFEEAAFRRFDAGPDALATFSFTPELFNPDLAGQ